MIVKLNLPQLPSTIKTAVRLLSNNLAHNDPSRHWLNQFHNESINAVNHGYELVPSINELVREAYGEFFKEPIHAMIGVQRNVTDQLACSPPHCDRGRHVAINYYIDLGGQNVTTCFYNYHRDDTNPAEAINLTQSSVQKISSHLLVNDSWYVFDAQQCHAVENIETLRIFLGLILESNPTFDEFVSNYNTLLL